jgi:hypothetical protein
MTIGKTEREHLPIHNQRSMFWRWLRRVEEKKPVICTLFLTVSEEPYGVVVPQITPDVS